MKDRCNVAGKRTRRVDVLARTDMRAARLGRTGVDPAQVYGVSAAGVDRKIITKQKQNLAIATGRRLRKGAAATIAVAWSYGTEAQPDIRAHMSHIDAWLIYWDANKVDKGERIGRAWKSR